MKFQGTSSKFYSHLVLCLILLIAVLSSIATAGCINKQSQQTAITSDQLEVKNKYFFNYNGTSYLTGILVNRAPKSLVNTNLQAEGYFNDTIYERGRAGPDSGIKSVLLPNESSPFMIKMVPTSSPGTSAQPTQKPELSYRIEPQVTPSLSARPYPLSAINTKAAASNQAINVSGEIYNGGNENISSSIVAAAFYQENGTVLGVFTGNPQGELGPERTTPFQIDVQTSAFPMKPARTEVYAYELID